MTGVQTCALPIFLDENLDPLPFGAVGELCISGKSISRGYMNNSQQQRERFIKNPIEGDPFPVLYRSGDLARFGVYGMIEVVGRIDDEVKVNGMRVHPAEIDRELLALEEISVAATIAIPTNSGSFVLVAYVEGSKPIDINKAKAHLEKRLPPSFVPTHIIESTIPRSRNGKVNRKELRDRPLLRPNIETPFETPTNEKELSICMFFSEVLGVENVGTEDNFFDHDELADPFAAGGGDGPQDAGQRQGDPGGAQPHHERDAGAVDGAREDVAAGLVGAERVLDQGRNG